MNNEHPIEGLMVTAMNSIQGMIDVNTIIGEPIETSNNVIIIPISKVGFGFAAGGSEFKGETIDEYSKKEKEEQVQYRLPFGGGSGAPVCHSSAVDRLLDYVQDLMEKMNNYLNKSMQNKKEEKKEELKKAERERKEAKETIENLAETVQNMSKTRPRRTRMQRPQQAYEFEYDEVDEDFENIPDENE